MTEPKTPRIVYVERTKECKTPGVVTDSFEVSRVEGVTDPLPGDSTTRDAMNALIASGIRVVIDKVRRNAR